MCFLKKFMKPKYFWSSLIFPGTGHLRTSSMCWSLIFTPSLETSNPKKSTRSLKKLHFFDFNLRLAFLKRSNTSCKLQYSSCFVLPWTITSSIYTQQVFIIKPSSTLSMHRWKIDGEFFSPNGNFKYSNNPHGVLNAVLSVWAS